MKKYTVTVVTTYKVHAETKDQAREIVETAEETQDYSGLVISDQDWEIEDNG